MRVLLPLLWNVGLSVRAEVVVADVDCFTAIFHTKISCQKLTQSQVWRINKMKENHSHLKTCDRVWNRSAQPVVVKSSVKDPRLQSVWLICVDASSNSHKVFSLLNRPISEGNVPESWFSANRLFS